MPVVPQETRVGEVLDPLTRASVDVQRLGVRAGGSALSVLFGALLVLDAARPLPQWAALLVGAGGLAALGAALGRRLRPKPSVSRARLDFEVASLAAVAVVHAVLQAPRGLDGAYAGLLYVGAVSLGAFARPAAGLATWLFLAALLVCLQAGRGGALAEHLPLWALLGAAGGLSYIALRRELVRSERSSRQRLDREVEKLREAARSYRLTAASGTTAAAGGAGSTQLPPALAANDDERLLRSSVDEIQAALCSALSLCRVALGSRSVLVLWLDDSGARLHLRAASSEDDGLAEGPFSAREGIFAAALESSRPMQLVGSSLIHPLPYYGGRRGALHVALLPILEEGRPSGLLVIDRAVPRELADAELEILAETERLVRRTVDNERVVLQLDRAQVEQGRLYRAVERLNEARSEVQVIEAGVSSARDFAAFQFAAVTLLRQGGEHEICAVSGEGAQALVGKTFRDPTGLVGMVVDNRHPLPYRGQATGNVQVLFTKSLSTPKFASLLVLPLLVHHEVLGTLVLGADEHGAFGGDVRISLQVLAGHIAVSLANARMVKRLEELATTDGLTGLLNKRTLTEIGRQKLRSAKRFQKALSVLICDLDHFKAVNDTHGHDVGDRVIRGFADVLRRTKRETDAVGRFGGEEFVLVCEQTDTVGAEQLAERIRAELGATTFVTAQGGALRVTCSIGVATYPSGGDDWDTLFKATDEALYASKRGGRDRVTLWTSRLRSAKAG